MSSVRCCPSSQISDSPAARRRHASAGRATARSPAAPRRGAAGVEAEAAGSLRSTSEAPAGAPRSRRGDAIRNLMRHEQPRRRFRAARSDRVRSTADAARASVRIPAETRLRARNASTTPRCRIPPAGRSACRPTQVRRGDATRWQPHRGRCTVYVVAGKTVDATGRCRLVASGRTDRDQPSLRKTSGSRRHPTSSPARRPREVHPEAARRPAAVTAARRARRVDVADRQRVGGDLVEVGRNVWRDGRPRARGGRSAAAPRLGDPPSPGTAAWSSSIARPGDDPVVARTRSVCHALSSIRSSVVWQTGVEGRADDVAELPAGVLA